jgi:SAM-dependent methyltransferase
MTGTVADVGGKHLGKRGEFVPDERAARWIYLNLDWSTSPLLVADAHQLPFVSGSVNCVLCCEVLEHLEDPEQCVREMQRVLVPGGVLLLSVPFFYPLHGDPYDYSRFTRQRIIKMCTGLNVVKIVPMGGWFGSLGMLLDIGGRSVRGWKGSAIIRLGTRVSSRFLSWLDRRFSPLSAEGERFTTGYFCVAEKPGRETELT